MLVGVFKKAMKNPGVDSSNICMYVDCMYISQIIDFNLKNISERFTGEGRELDDKG